MKRSYIYLVMLLMLILLAACNGREDTTTVKKGIYLMEHEASEEGIAPRVNIGDDGISFMYDLLSSYFPVGTYEIEEKRLIMTTDDKLHTYTFEIDGDHLVFQAGESSRVNLLNNRIGIEVTDQAVFKLQDH